MIESDLLITFVVMGLLFVRQIAILKEPNKINYGPLMLGIGIGSSIIHFMIHPHSNDILLLTRESLFPLLVAVILYLIMNVLQQTQQTSQVRMQEEFITIVIQEIEQLKEFIAQLEQRMNSAQNETIQTQQEVREKFREDVKVLSSIKANQEHFLEKFLQVETWHKDVKKSFAYFSEEQLPKLDDVVHKHIDILRISESDHYNKLQELLKKAVESRYDISDELHEVEKKVDNLSLFAEDVATKIAKESTQHLINVTKDFEKEILLLKSNAGMIATSLHEGETTLANIRTQSELIMKQMVLSSKRMDELVTKNSEIGDFLPEFQALLVDVESIKSDYVKAQSELTSLSHELQAREEEMLNAITEKFDTLSKELNTKIESSLDDLHKHYHLIGENVTTKANFLAKKVQIPKGYSDID